MCIQNRIEYDHMPVELYCLVKNGYVQPNVSDAVKIDKLIWTEEKSTIFTTACCP